MSSPLVLDLCGSLAGLRTVLLHPGMDSFTPVNVPIKKSQLIHIKKSP